MYNNFEILWFMFAGTKNKDLQVQLPYNSLENKFQCFKKTILSLKELTF
jgi:hypothetical protein